MPCVNDHGVNLADFDSRNEGIVDAINILYAGDSLYQGDLWPHNSVKVSALWQRAHPLLSGNRSG